MNVMAIAVDGSFSTLNIDGPELPTECLGAFEWQPILDISDEIKSLAESGLKQQEEVE